MSKLFFGSIDFTKLHEMALAGHSSITKSDSNGHIYVNIAIWDNEEKDKYGNQLGIQLNSSKEARDGGLEKDKVYIGNAKPSEKQPGTSSPVAAADVPPITKLPF